MGSGTGQLILMQEKTGCTVGSNGLGLSLVQGSPLAPEQLLFLPCCLLVREEPMQPWRPGALAAYSYLVQLYLWTQGKARAPPLIPGLSLLCWVLSSLHTSRTCPHHRGGQNLDLSTDALLSQTVLKSDTQQFILFSQQLPI